MDKDLSRLWSLGLWQRSSYPLKSLVVNLGTSNSGKRRQAKLMFLPSVMFCRTVSDKTSMCGRSSAGYPFPVARDVGCACALLLYTFCSIPVFWHDWHVLEGWLLSMSLYTTHCKLVMVCCIAAISLKEVTSFEFSWLRLLFICVSRVSQSFTRFCVTLDVEFAGREDSLDLVAGNWLKICNNTFFELLEVVFIILFSISVCSLSSWLDFPFHMVDVISSALLPWSQLRVSITDYNN